MSKKISEVVRIVTSLIDDDMQWLLNDGIETEDDLRYISLDELLKEIKVVTRRKIRFVEGSSLS